ncbi:MAG: sulfate adenylyltransferase [Burkholderiaceae bacterium]|jgi:sulfate adenylyltransferase subunit 1|nr:sulfate adenylyltransferase [Burkholderiaceae bacterium]
MRQATPPTPNNTPEHAAAPASASAATVAAAAAADALHFITCGSVDDGKSTLIGRLLIDSRAVLQDHLAGVQRAGQTDLALLTDGLSAEREQGITIDVAYRYFATEARKFIIGDAPGHEQYTRNMVTAASSADAAVVLVDATKTNWRDAALQLLPQTRRHTLLAHLLRVPAIVFAVNKLDAVDDPALAFRHISATLQTFAQNAGVTAHAIVPISALKGYNVVQTAAPNWAGYSGPSLLQVLEQLPNTPHATDGAFGFAVQWVEKFSSSSDTRQGRRIFWGRVATGIARPGLGVQIAPGGAGSAVIAQTLDHTRQPQNAICAGHSAGIVLDREVDVSRGLWLLQPGAFEARREASAIVAWLDEEALLPGRPYWALHGHHWLKARVKRIVHQLDVNTLERIADVASLPMNGIARVELAFQEPVVTLPYSQSRTFGAMILVDAATNQTSGAVMLR